MNNIFRPEPADELPFSSRMTLRQIWKKLDEQYHEKEDAEQDVQNTTV